MWNDRIESLEQELFLLSEKFEALSAGMRRITPLPGEGINVDLTDHGAVIGRLPGPRSGLYDGDFTLVISARAVNGAPPRVAVVALEHGADTDTAGTVYANGLGSAEVPRTEFAAVDNRILTIYLRTGYSDGKLNSALFLSDSGASFDSGLYDTVIIGSFFWRQENDSIQLYQSWRSGSRQIDYRWW